MSAPSFAIVVPSSGRPSLAALLRTLSRETGAAPDEVIVVLDGPAASAPELPHGVRVLRGSGAGPAAARNIGWRASSARWVAFLDDDVVPRPGWLEALAEDLAELPPEVAGSQGRLHVPLPPGRRPTDWERNVRGLEAARWATADMAYRRSALARVGGFDERFPRAYREDADLGLRILGAGLQIVTGTRAADHPVRPAGRGVSVGLQAGNADDVLMRALHGRGWRARAGVPTGRRRRHLATSGAAAAALAALLLGRRRLAAFGAAAWLAGTLELALARIAPGPRTRSEIGTMLATSVLIPPAAALHTLRGLARRRALRRLGSPRPDPPAAVLLDRDGTLVVDVPYNADPARVVPLPGVREALDRLRGAGIPTAVVSNQSGVARGLISIEELAAVSRRVEEVLGPLGPAFHCVHGPEDGCGCRKPAPGLVLQAAAALGVAPERCVLVGDIGADVEAARAAGARAVLVPTAATLQAEIDASPEVAPTFAAAIELLLGRAA